MTPVIIKTKTLPWPLFSPVSLSVLLQLIKVSLLAQMIEAEKLLFFLTTFLCCCAVTSSLGIAATTNGTISTCVAPPTEACSAARLVGAYVMLCSIRPPNSFSTNLISLIYLNRTVYIHTSICVCYISSDIFIWYIYPIVYFTTYLFQSIGR